MEENQKVLQNLCRLFLHFMTHTKKLSAHSLKAYTADLKEFFEIKELTLTRKKTILKVQNKRALEQKIKFLIEKNTSKQNKLANSSRSRKLAVARSFIKWLSEQNYIEEDFRFLFKSPKTPYRMPSFLSVDEIFSILEMFKKEENKKPTDKALFFLLYGGGLRVGEACRLKNKEINWLNHALKITGKGNKQRLISLPEKAFKYLKAFKTNQVYLFGKTPLSERKAYDIIKSIGQRAGLLKPLHPHALRHSFATHMLSGGSDLRMLQELLGHKTLTATQKYTHLDLFHLSKALENCHPLNETS